MDPSEPEPSYQILVDNQPAGPFPLSEVVRRMESGEFRPEQLAWSENWPEWRTLGELFPECVPIAIPTPGAVSPQPDSRGTEADPSLLSALAYPVRGDGGFMLVAGTLFFSLLSVGTMFAPMASLVVGVFSAGYLLLALQGVVQSSSAGEERMPSWPAFESAGWLAETLERCLLWVGTIAVCLGPGYFLAFLAPASDQSTVRGIGFALLAGGCIYLPMALLAVAMTDSLAGLDPRLVIPSIAAIPGKYAASLLLLAMVLGLQFCLKVGLDRVHLPLLGGLINGFVSLYFAIVQARILGLLYYTSRHRFTWS